ncbi:retropepsin-like aspartic protease family protein [Sphingopyxis chilensis]|uniref:retropepsin-like aspartic protease family protein n=1 Tax=Sphingopyxis chilensis TaxID=180400 RepID=UPI002DDCF110|nr:TIGR02281 family clan AA aspartic protease [Sphingopyxis chilensis]
MPLTTDLPWDQLAIYAVGAALILLLLFRIPYVGRVFSALFSFALLAFAIFLVLQQAPFDPNLSRITASLGLDRQRVVGGEVRIPMARDGHFWAAVRLNGTERRMLVDSGATVTALSRGTASAAGIEPDATLMPLIMKTANGTVRADAGTVGRLEIGDIEARGLKVVIAPGLGDTDVLGMNFLSELQSWRVEGKTLILVPAAPNGAADKGQIKEAARYVREEAFENGDSPEAKRKAQEGRDLRNAGRIEDGKPPKTTPPGTDS